MKNLIFITSLLLTLIIASCSKDIDKNQRIESNEINLKANIDRYNQTVEEFSNVTYHASPDPGIGCAPPLCGYIQGTCHLTTGFEFDLSSCISPDPLSYCQVEILPDICSFLYYCNGSLYVEIQDIESFNIMPDCLPENYSVDMDCVIDQLIYQYMPTVLGFWDLVDPNFAFSEAVYTVYEKQLCASYCTVWGPYPVVNIVPCEESFSCCRTEIRWNKNNEGKWIPGPIEVDLVGECSGPSPKCKSGNIFNGPNSTSPLSSSCEPRNCFQPESY